MNRYVFLLVLLAGCWTAPNKAVNTLDNAGFTEITTTGYTFFACGEDDVSATGFKAKNPNGKVVTGTVCCGLLTKSCTIRF